MSTQDFYVAPGRIVWHSQEEKYYRENEKIDLSHLDADQIEAVLKSGAVTKQAPIKETSNG